MIDLFVQHGSYIGIVLFLILTGCGLPVPEEVPIVMAGVFSAQGTLQPALALGACLFGALVGDCLIYAIGYHFGHNLLKDHPRFARFLRADRESKFEDLITRHGLKVLLVGRFMIGVRSPVYLSAGVLRIPFRRFLLMDIFCVTLVVSAFFGLSFAFGEHILKWIRGAEIGLTVTVLLAVASVVALLYWRRKRQTARSGAAAKTAEHPGVFKPGKRTVA